MEIYAGNSRLSSIVRSQLVANGAIIHVRRAIYKRLYVQVSNLFEWNVGLLKANLLI